MDIRFDGASKKGKSPTTRLYTPKKDPEADDTLRTPRSGSSRMKPDEPHVRVDKPEMTVLGRMGLILSGFLLSGMILFTLAGYERISRAYADINALNSEIESTSLRINELDVQIECAVTIQDAQKIAEAYGMRYPEKSQYVKIGDPLPFSGGVPTAKPDDAAATTSPSTSPETPTTNPETTPEPDSAGAAGNTQGGGAKHPRTVKFERKDDSRMAKETSKGPKLKRKLVLLMVFAGLLMFLLAMRLSQVMLVQGPELKKKAETQWTRRQNLAAQRGRIIDRNGLVLAQSGTSYRVLANPPSIAPDDRVRVATEVSDILGLDYDYVLQRISPDADGKLKLQVQLKRQVESSVIDQLEALQLGNGISYTTDMKRYYPFGQLFTQLVGFTGIETEGQTGLEAEYNTYLAGTSGLLVAEVDRKNNPLSYGTPEKIDAVDGYDMAITGDSVAQSYLEKYLKQCYEVNRPISASGLIMNPNTGEILAISTYPSFDLNNPPRDMVTELMSMSRARIVTDTYEAGTMFDVITTAAGIDAGTTSVDSSFNCDGSRTFRLEKVRCWKTGGHGDETLAEALGNSCNVAMIDVAESTGVNKLYDYIYSFGFNESTECGIPSEDTGEVIHRKYIRESDLAHLAFGETITTTAIQMANAFCAVINGGTLMQPYVVSSITDKDGKEIVKNEPTILRRVISSATSASMRTLLQSVVDNGNGSSAKVMNYQIGGITGVSRKFEEDDVTPSRVRVVASFCGFIPVNDPQLVCMIVIDEPQVPVLEASKVAGYWASKVFSDLVQYYGILPDTTSKTRTVPNVVGMTGKDAVYELTKAGLPAYVVPGEEEALVVSQFPAAETIVPSGMSVVLYTSMTTFNDEGLYSNQVDVPKLIGKRRQDAFDTLTKLGLLLSFDKTLCTGQIDTQSEPEGAKVSPGTTIYVTFQTPVPTEAPTTSGGTPAATPVPEE